MQELQPYELVRAEATEESTEHLKNLDQPQENSVCNLYEGKTTLSFTTAVSYSGQCTHSGGLRTELEAQYNIFTQLSKWVDR